MTPVERALTLASVVGSLALCAGGAFASTGIDIVIEDNQSLQSLKGLGGVIAVNGLVIKSNPGLTDLNGLEKLDKVLDALVVETNPNLQDCKALAVALGWPDGENQNVGSATISGNLPNCSNEIEILDDVLGPTKPTITDHSFTLPPNSVGDSIIDMALTFDPAVGREQSLFPVTGHRGTCTSEVEKGDPDNPSIGAALLDYEPVSRTLDMPGSAGSDDSLFIAEIQVDIDITHTDPVDLFVKLENPERASVVLWNQRSPGSEDLIGTFSTTLSPAEPLSGLARARMGGEWTLVVEDVGKGPIIRTGMLNTWGLRISEESVTDGPATSPITIRGVGHSADYTCTLAALSRLGAIPVSDPYSIAIPRLSSPAQPVIYATDVDDGVIILYVTVSDNGGTNITEYDATCTDGTNTYTGASTSSPITVSGLTNDVPYTCTVTATNTLGPRLGPSAASAMTDPITPEVVNYGLPIWLLYQATQ